MLTGYPLSCTLGRSVLGIGSGVARFLMTAEYATYRYLRCVVNVMILLSQLSFSFVRINYIRKRDSRFKGGNSSTLLFVANDSKRNTYFYNISEKGTRSISDWDTASRP